ncbi:MULTISPECIES: hypothetical protein [unclassified Microcoleus]|uniref:hypothetical protein n=1 Tax=unclassified Microcoleus TaxID=2642155 RepID=UPI002FD697EB
MKTLLAVVKAILEILINHKSQLAAIQNELKMDNESDLTESDIAGLKSQVEALNLGIGNNEAMPL